MLFRSLTIQYQSLIANCYKKIDGKRKDKDFNLRVFAYSRASFNVHMYAESDLNLFGSSRLNNTLSIIDDLLSNPTDDLKNRLIPVKGHTVRSYKSFIKLLLENNISIKYKWVSSISESHVVGNRVSFENLNRIYKVLEESLELENEIDRKSVV